MRKAIGVVLIGIGVFGLVLTILLPTVVVDRSKKTPLDLNITQISSGKAQLFDATSGEVKQVDLRATRVVRTDSVHSDGKNTTGATDPIGVAQTAKRLGIRINTVALGTPTGTVQVQDNLGFTQTIQVPPDRPTLRQIAQTTGGRFFSAPNANHLQQIYKDLGSKVKAKPVKKEVSFVPAAAAIVLMLAAGGFSLLWFGRLP